MTNVRALRTSPVSKAPEIIRGNTVGGLNRKLVSVMVNVAVLGYGTVGSGVAEVIWTNQEKVDKSAGVPVRIKYVLDLREFPGDPVEKVLVHDFDVILKIMWDSAI